VTSDQLVVFSKFPNLTTESRQLRKSLKIITITMGTLGTSSTYSL